MRKGRRSQSNAKASSKEDTSSPVRPSLGTFSLGVAMGDEEPVNLWNSLMRLVHCYDTILDIDQDIDEELREELRLRVAEIDKEIEELRERHNGVMV